MRIPKKPTGYNGIMSPGYLGACRPPFQRNDAARRGTPIDKGFLYKLLNNRVYIGDAVHEGTAYPGEHEAIITIDLWNRVHCILQESPRVRARVPA